jgi:hypothetical protein
MAFVTKSRWNAANVGHREQHDDDTGQSPLTHGGHRSRRRGQDDRDEDAHQQFDRVRVTGILRQACEHREPAHDEDEQRHHRLAGRAPREVPAARQQEHDRRHRRSSRLFTKNVNHGPS